ncbi:MAG: protein kinase [Endomicrobiales bacterium]|nr:protein kinase [Endomicrobiales bacterium]
MILKKSPILALKKFVASATAACFIFSSVAAEGLYAAVQGQNSTSDFKRMIDEFVIPANIGKVSSLKSFESPVVVVNVQDLHCHPEVQRNISRVISIIDGKYGLSAVFVEGASGKLDTSWFAGLGDKKLKNSVVENLVDRGRLTGTEHYSIISGKTSLLKGLEDPKVYRANYLRLDAILSKRSTYGALLDEMSKDLERAKGRTFHSRNVRLERTIKKYQEGKLPAEKYYKLLLKLADKLTRDAKKFRKIADVRPGDFPSITGFIELSEVGRKLQYRRIARQLQEFMKILKQKLPYSAYNYLLEKTDNFRKLDELYVYLARMADEYRLDLSVNYPQLAEFFSYLEKSKNVNPMSLIGEEKTLIEELRAGFSMTKSELEVAFLSDFYSYFKDYLNNSISADDYEFFSKRFAEFKTLWVTHCGTARIAGLEKDFELLDAYYKGNVERNGCFIKNILADLGPDYSGISAGSGTDPQKMLDGAKKVAVVVSGGFHTRGIEKLLSDKRISFITVTPNVTQDTKTAEAVYNEIAKTQARILKEAFANMPLFELVGEFGRTSDARKAEMLSVVIGTVLSVFAGADLQAQRADIEKVLNGAPPAMRPSRVEVAGNRIVIASPQTGRSIVFRAEGGKIVPEGVPSVVSPEEEQPASLGRQMPQGAALAVKGAGQSARSSILASLNLPGIVNAVLSTAGSYGTEKGLIGSLAGQEKGDGMGLNLLEITGRTQGADGKAIYTFRVNEALMRHFSPDVQARIKENAEAIAGMISKDNALSSLVAAFPWIGEIVINSYQQEASPDMTVGGEISHAERNRRLQKKILEANVWTMDSSGEISTVPYMSELTGKPRYLAFFYSAGFFINYLLQKSRIGGAQYESRKNAVKERIRQVRGNLSDDRQRIASRLNITDGYIRSVYGLSAAEYDSLAPEQKDSLRKQIAARLINIALVTELNVVKGRLTLHDGGPFAHARRGIASARPGIWIGEKLFSERVISDDDIARVLIEEAMHILAPIAPHGAEGVEHDVAIAEKLEAAARRLGEPVTGNFCEADMTLGEEDALELLGNLETIRGETEEAPIDPYEDYLADTGEEESGGGQLSLSEMLVRQLEATGRLSAKEINELDMQFGSIRGLTVAGVQIKAGHDLLVGLSGQAGSWENFYKFFSFVEKVLTRHGKTEAQIITKALGKSIGTIEEGTEEFKRMKHADIVEVFGGELTELPAREEIPKIHKGKELGRGGLKRAFKGTWKGREVCVIEGLLSSSEYFDAVEREVKAFNSIAQRQNIPGAELLPRIISSGVMVEQRDAKGFTVRGENGEPVYTYLLDEEIDDPQAYRTKGKRFYVIDYAVYKDMIDFLESAGTDRLNPAGKLRMMILTLTALQTAHSMGLVHGDLKWNNVLLFRGLKPVLSDWGSVRAVPGGGLTDVLPDEEAFFGGTPLFMPPDRMMKSGDKYVPAQPSTVRMEVFSLGVMLYQLVLGDFKASVYGVKPNRMVDYENLMNSEAIASRLGDESILSVRTPEEFQFISLLTPIIVKALKANPEERYGSVIEMLDDIWSVAREMGLDAEKDLNIPPNLRDPRAATETIGRLKVSGTEHLGAVPTASMFVKINKSVKDKRAAMKGAGIGVAGRLMQGVFAFLDWATDATKGVPVIETLMIWGLNAGFAWLGVSPVFIHAVVGLTFAALHIVLNREDITSLRTWQNFVIRAGFGAFLSLLVFYVPTSFSFFNVVSIAKFNLVVPAAIHWLWNAVADSDFGKKADIPPLSMFGDPEKQPLNKSLNFMLADETLQLTRLERSTIARHVTVVKDIASKDPQGLKLVRPHGGILDKETRQVYIQKDYVDAAASNFDENDLINFVANLLADAHYLRILPLAPAEKDQDTYALNSASRVRESYLRRFDGLRELFADFKAAGTARIEIRILNGKRYIIKKFVETRRAIFEIEARILELVANNRSVFRRFLNDGLMHVDRKDRTLVTRLIEGVPLNRYFVDLIESRDTGIELHEAIAIILMCLEGVSVLHDNGVAHKDLNPRNIIVRIGRKGKIYLKIIDFSSSKFFDAKYLHVNPQTRSFTPYYTRPDKDPVGSPSSDIFSLGVIMHYLLTGRVPQQLTARAQVDYVVRDEEFAEYYPVAADLIRIIKKAVNIPKADGTMVFGDEYEPYANVREMIDDLSALMVSNPEIGERVQELIPTEEEVEAGSELTKNFEEKERVLEAVEKRIGSKAVAALAAELYNIFRHPIDEFLRIFTPGAFLKKHKKTALRDAARVLEKRRGADVAYGVTDYLGTALENFSADQLEEAAEALSSGGRIALVEGMLADQKTAGAAASMIVFMLFAIQGPQEWSKGRPVGRSLDSQAQYEYSNIMLEAIKEYKESQNRRASGVALVWAFMAAGTLLSVCGVGAALAGIALGNVVGHLVHNLFFGKGAQMTVDARLSSDQLVNKIKDFLTQRTFSIAELAEHFGVEASIENRRITFATAISMALNDLSGAYDFELQKGGIKIPGSDTPDGVKSKLWNLVRGAKDGFPGDVTIVLRSKSAVPAKTHVEIQRSGVTVTVDSDRPTTVEVDKRGSVVVREDKAARTVIIDGVEHQITYIELADGTVKQFVTKGGEIQEAKTQDEKRLEQGQSPRDLTLGVVGIHDDISAGKTDAGVRTDYSDIERLIDGLIESPRPNIRQVGDVLGKYMEWSLRSNVVAAAILQRRLKDLIDAAVGKKADAGFEYTVGIDKHPRNNLFGITFTFHSNAPDPRTGRKRVTNFNFLYDEASGAIIDESTGAALTLPSTYRFARWIASMLGRPYAQNLPDDWYATPESRKKYPEMTKFAERIAAPIALWDIVAHTALLLIGRGEANVYRVGGAIGIWGATAGAAFAAASVFGAPVLAVIAAAVAANVLTHSAYNAIFGTLGVIGADSPLTLGGKFNGLDIDPRQYAEAGRTYSDEDIFSILEKMREDLVGQAQSSGRFNDADIGRINKTFNDIKGMLMNPGVPPEIKRNTFLLHEYYSPLIKTFGHGSPVFTGVMVFLDRHYFPRHIKEERSGIDTINDLDELSEYVGSYRGTGAAFEGEIDYMLGLISAVKNSLASGEYRNVRASLRALTRGERKGYESIQGLRYKALGLVFKELYRQNFDAIKKSAAVKGMETNKQNSIAADLKEAIDAIRSDYVRYERRNDTAIEEKIGDEIGALFYRFNRDPVIGGLITGICGTLAEILLKKPESLVLVSRVRRAASPAAAAPVERSDERTQRQVAEVYERMRVENIQARVKQGYPEGLAGSFYALSTAQMKIIADSIFTATRKAGGLDALMVEFYSKKNELEKQHRVRGVTIDPNKKELSVFGYEVAIEVLTAMGVTPQPDIHRKTGEALGDAVRRQSGRQLQEGARVAVEEPPRSTDKGSIAAVVIPKVAEAVRGTVNPSAAVRGLAVTSVSIASAQVGTKYVNFIAGPFNEIVVSPQFRAMGAIGILPLRLKNSGDAIELGAVNVGARDVTVLFSRYGDNIILAPGVDLNKKEFELFERRIRELAPLEDSWLARRLRSEGLLESAIREPLIAKPGTEIGSGEPKTQVIPGAIAGSAQASSEFSASVGRHKKKENTVKGRHMVFSVNASKLTGERFAHIRDANAGANIRIRGLFKGVKAVDEDSAHGYIKDMHAAGGRILCDFEVASMSDMNDVSRWLSKGGFDGAEIDLSKASGARAALSRINEIAKQDPELILTVVIPAGMDTSEMITEGNISIVERRAIRSLMPTEMTAKDNACVVLDLSAVQDDIKDSGVGGFTLEKIISGIKANMLEMSIEEISADFDIPVDISQIVRQAENLFRTSPKMFYEIADSYDAVDMPSAEAVGPVLELFRKHGLSELIALDVEDLSEFKLETDKAAAFLKELGDLLPESVGEEKHTLLKYAFGARLAQLVSETEDAGFKVAQAAGLVKGVAERALLAKFVASAGILGLEDAGQEKVFRTLLVSSELELADNLEKYLKPENRRGLAPATVTGMLKSAVMLGKDLSVISRILDILSDVPKKEHSKEVLSVAYLLGVYAARTGDAKALNTPMFAGDSAVAYVDVREEDSASFDEVQKVYYFNALSGVIAGMEKCGQPRNRTLSGKLESLAGTLRIGRTSIPSTADAGMYLTALSDINLGVDMSQAGFDVAGALGDIEMKARTGRIRMELSELLRIYGMHAERRIPGALDKVNEISAEAVKALLGAA